MPSSTKEGKSVIKEWVTEFKDDVDVVLDLGVGNGTYHRLFSRKWKILDKAKWIGIEAWEPYIAEFDLINRYNNIVNADIRQIDYKALGPFDLVFAGDVLEHVTKEDAIKIIDDLLECSKRIIISIPIIHYPQDEEFGNPFEAHVKDDWSHEEMLETFPHIKKMWAGNVIGVYMLSK